MSFMTPPSLLVLFFFKFCIYSIHLMLVDGSWGEWEQWSACHERLGCGWGGVSKRYRHCNNPAPLNGGKHCPAWVQIEDKLQLQREVSKR